MASDNVSADMEADDGVKRTVLAALEELSGACGPTGKNFINSTDSRVNCGLRTSAPPERRHVLIQLKSHNTVHISSIEYERIEGEEKKHSNIRALIYLSCPASVSWRR